MVSLRELSGYVRLVKSERAKKLFLSPAPGMEGTLEWKEKQQYQAICFIDIKKKDSVWYSINRLLLLGYCILQFQENINFYHAYKFCYEWYNVMHNIIFGSP